MECFSYDRADVLVCLKERCRSALCYSVDMNTHCRAESMFALLCFLVWAMGWPWPGFACLVVRRWWSGTFGPFGRPEQNRTYNILTLKITLGMDATAKASQLTYFKGDMLLDFRAWCPGSLLRLLSPSSFFLLLSLLLLSSLDLSLDFDVDLSFFSSSFSNSYRTE